MIITSVDRFRTHLGPRLNHVSGTRNILPGISVTTALYCRTRLSIHNGARTTAVHDGGRIETPGTCAFNIHSIYLSIKKKGKWIQVL